MKNLDEIYESRYNRAIKMIEKLNDIGIQYYLRASKEYS